MILVLAERAHSEGARSMAAMGQPGRPSDMKSEKIIEGPLDARSRRQPCRPAE